MAFYVLLPEHCCQYAPNTCKQARHIRYMSSLWHHSSLGSTVPRLCLPPRPPTLARGTRARQNIHCVTRHSEHKHRPPSPTSLLKTEPVFTCSGRQLNGLSEDFHFPMWPYFRCPWAIGGVCITLEAQEARCYYRCERKGHKREPADLNLENPDCIYHLRLCCSVFFPQNLIQILKHFLVSWAFSHFIIKKMERHPYNGLNDIKKFTLKVYTLLLF